MLSCAPCVWELDPQKFYAWPCSPLNAHSLEVDSMSRQNQIIAYAIIVLLYTCTYFLVYLRLCIYYSIYIHAAYISQLPTHPTTALSSFKEHNTFDAPEFPERPNLAKIFIKGMPKRPGRGCPVVAGVWQGWSFIVWGWTIHGSGPENRHGQVEFLGDLTFIIPPLISSLLILSSF